MEANKLVCGDIKRLSNVFTYSNSDHSRFSWIDHILSTNLLDNTISDLQILYDYVLSDHKPVSVAFDDIVITDSCAEQDSADVIFTRHCWDKVDDVTMFHYTTYVDQLLQSIVVPRVLQECLVTGGCRSWRDRQQLTDVIRYRRTVRIHFLKIFFEYFTRAILAVHKHYHYHCAQW